MRRLFPSAIVLGIRTSIGLPPFTVQSQIPQRRHFKFAMDLENPKLTLDECRLEMASELDKHRHKTRKYYEVMINVGLCLLASDDVVAARDHAVKTHDEVCRSRSGDSPITFFSARVAARCCRRLRECYEARLAEREKRSALLQDLLITPKNKADMPDKIIATLKEQEEQYLAHAHRLYMMPENFFMRSDEENGSRMWWDSDDPSSEDHATFRNRQRKRAQHYEKRRTMQRSTRKVVPR